MKNMRTHLVLVGKWISYQRNAVIKMTKDNKITVYTPDVPFRGDPQRIGL